MTKCWIIQKNSLFSLYRAPGTLCSLFLIFSLLFSWKILMVQHVFCIFIDYRGHHRKGFEICNADYVIFSTKTMISTEKMYLWTIQRGPNNKKIHQLTSIWSWKYFSGDLLRAALYRLMLVLHKDALFHSYILLYCNGVSFSDFSRNFDCHWCKTVFDWLRFAASVTRWLEKNCQTFGKSSQNSCQVKYAKISTSEQN
jgi:hypothetical protein